MQTAALTDARPPACCICSPPPSHLWPAAQMNLLDRAIKLAAEQDEPEDMNFVRKHAIEQVPPLGVMSGLPAAEHEPSPAQLQALQAADN